MSEISRSVTTLLAGMSESEAQIFLARIAREAKEASERQQGRQADHLEALRRESADDLAARLRQLQRTPNAGGEERKAIAQVIREKTETSGGGNDGAMRRIIRSKLQFGSGPRGLGKPLNMVELQTYARSIGWVGDLSKLTSEVSQEAWNEYQSTQGEEGF